ncbi:MAG TPA: bacillithiol biosynthesis cysteine-adding enzyme BshC [Flavipsychrobacter sp.]|nr:bacillithiol biosynthesis cysteine-adding enzyme BshC [Flavipsychrobacter sp.]
MPSDCTYLPYKNTHSFSKLVVDYLSEHKNLREFYTFSPDLEGIKQAIRARKEFPVNRSLLVSVLNRQYKDLKKSSLLEANVAALAAENTFTICTAHQPNLLTGYLYFVYKILHAIKLSQELSAAFPDKRFVPVYYMGSEDNDLAELGTFRYNGEKYNWDGAGQTGAVGRMDTKSLKEVFNSLFKKMGPPGANLEQLKELISTAYLEHATIGQATQYLVNELFGKYGLVVLDPDDAVLKTEFTHIMKDDLLQGVAEKLVTEEAGKLSVNYKSQVHPRNINLFYLKEQLRERIEKEGDTWRVLNTDVVFTEEQLLVELQEHPERFSPNVVLRGLFQETILPDVAFIGGGAEVAYWLELKRVFEYYNVFYPAILLRQSLQWISKEAKIRMDKLKLSIPDIFSPGDEMIRNYLLKEAKNELDIDEQTNELEVILGDIKNKAINVDPTLAYSAEAVLKKINDQLEVLRKKMLRAEKRKKSVDVERMQKLKTLLFPGGGLQERVENFMEYYLCYGEEWFDKLLQAMEPLRHEFLVIEGDK